MATTGHENESINVEGLKSSLQALKTKFIDSINSDLSSLDSRTDILEEAVGTGGSVDSRIAAAVNTLDSTKSQNAGTDGLALNIVEENGKITSISGSIASNTYDAYGAASAAQSAAATDATSKVNAAKAEIKGNATSACDTLGEAEAKINANTTAISNEVIRAQAKEQLLQDQYNALTQSDIIVGSLPASGTKNKIYRVPGSTSYSDYMWNGSTWVLMATYNNAIDNVPIDESDNLVKSGGVLKYLVDTFGFIVTPENWALVGQCSISGAGGWDVSSTYESKSFSVAKLRDTKIIVKANNIGTALISFVKTIGYPNNPVFATGETGRHVISVSTSAELTVPADANYAVVTTKNDNIDRTPQIYTNLNKIQSVEYAVSILNMLSAAYTKQVGNYLWCDGKAFDNPIGHLTEDAEYRIVAFCCSKQDTTISIINNTVRTIRVFILNAFTGLTAISASANGTQTISLNSYNSDYINNIVLVSMPKTTSISVDGVIPTTNITDNIADTIYRTTFHTILGKAMDVTTGEVYDSPEYCLSYFSTDSDTFTISFSSVQLGRTIRVFAFEAGVFLGEIYEVLPSVAAVDIDVNFHHHGVVFVLHCHRDNVFTISNLVTEDGLSEKIKKLSVNSNNITYLIDTYLNKGRVVYSAHRGLRTVAPENSIPAYEEAGRAGFDFLNLAQLRQSADGTWYVMHDDTIDRTTDGTGQIKNLTDDYLQTVHIDVGPNIEQYSQEELVIPTLEKAIQIARKYGMKLYFRIASITGNSYQADKSAWDSFIAIIRKYRCEGMLFGGNALTDLLPLHRNLGLDWCINYDVYSSEAVFQQITNYVNAGIKNATIFTTSEILTDAHITAARENGFKVMVHLTNDNATKTQCLEWSNKGVDIIGGVVNYDLGAD